MFIRNRLSYKTNIMQSRANGLTLNFGRKVMKIESVSSRGRRPAERNTCNAVGILARIIIGSALLACVVFADTTPTDASLKKVFIVFRHGDRNPTETYANDPYIDYPWPGGWGALTKRGMRQMYRLGQWARKEYGWITNYTYEQASTLVNSSYSDRCIMSTQAMLAGLYYEENAFTDGLPWRPIAVHYLPEQQDQILVVGKDCPRLAAALAESYKNESRRSDAELSSYYQQLTNITGQPMKTLTDVEFLYNTLEIEVMNGLELPKSIREYYNSFMRQLAARSYTLFTSNTLQRRLRGGPLLKHILDNMKNGVQSEKIFLYGTHDINIENTLRAMGFTEELFKLDLGVALVYEMRMDQAARSPQVRISMLNNTETTRLHQLRIAGCGDFCSLDELYEIWSDVLPEDWEAECQL